MLWAGGFGGGTLGLWVGSFSAHAPPPEVKWIFLALWVVGNSELFCGFVREESPYRRRHALCPRTTGARSRCRSRR